MKKHILLLTALVSLLAACSHPSPSANGQAVPLSNAQLAIYHDVADTLLLCQPGRQCNVYWLRAQKWVKENSAFPITAESDTVIDTAGPSATHDSRSAESLNAAFHVRKMPDYDNRIRITFNARCANNIACVPSILELKASFMDEVAGRHLQQRLQALREKDYQGRLWVMQAGAMQHIINECRKSRIRGEITTFTQSIDCSSPKIRQAYVDAAYPYMDLIDRLLAERLQAAREADAGDITPLEVPRKFAEAALRLDMREQKRMEDEN